MIAHYQCYKLHLFQCIQPSNHLFIEYRTNYRAKFNFIGIKKTKGVPKFFLKDRQIKNFKLLYIIFFIFYFLFFSGQDGPETTLALR